MMAHKAARTIMAAAELYDNMDFLGMDPMVQVVNTHPQHVHKIQTGVLEPDSPLLNSTRGADLAQILAHRIILLDPAQLDSYSDSNIVDAPGTIPALLRRAWYDTYSYVASNASQPDYIDGGAQ